MKLLTKLGLGLALAATCLTGCGENNKDLTKVGIIQLATHGALDASREGFIEGMKQEGFIEGVNVTFSVDNPEGDTATLSAMAKTMVRENDLLLGIATPAATALQAAAKTQGKSAPILFTAVTDAVDAGLVKSNTAPGGQITGTSDMNPVAEQIDLTLKLLPNAKKIGILYTVSETNSEVQAKLAKAQADKIGLECIIETFSDSPEISTVTRSLISKGVEAIYIPTDNKLAANMTAVTEVAYQNKIPVICAESNLVTAGGTVSLGIDYYKLGVLTGKMAASILKGGSPATTPVGFLSASEYELAINEEAFAKCGINPSVLKG